MANHATYFIILAASAAGPVLLSFDKKVAFYKKWKYVFPAMMVPALLYIVWDIYFTGIGVWSFNEAYITGFKIANLPVEEVLFFFVMPYCCLFIYECIRCYFPKLENKKPAQLMLLLLSSFLLITGLAYFNRAYTAGTFIALALCMAALLFTKRVSVIFNAPAFLVSYIIILIPFLVVNGFLTSIPVVLYNNTENLGIRISTIPVEDIFYGMLLVLLNVVIYEWLKNRK